MKTKTDPHSQYQSSLLESCRTVIMDIFTGTEPNLQSDFLITFLDTIPVPVFYKNVSGKYLGCNKAYEQFIGKNKEEIIGRTVYEIGQQELAEKYEIMDRELFEHPGKQIYEWKVKLADGNERNVIFHKATFNDSAGKIAGLIGLIQGVTELIQTIDALREGKQDVKYILNTSTESMVLIDTSGIVLEANDTICYRLRSGAETLKGKDLYAFFSPEIAESRRKMADKVIAEGKPFHFEDESDGFSILNSIYPVFDKEGKVDRLAIFGMDFTAVKKAADSLRRNKEVYQLTIEAAIDGYAHLDLNGKILEVNEAYCTISGYTREELLNMYIFDVEANESYEQTVVHICKVIESGKDHFTTKHRTKNGRTLDIEVSTAYSEKAGPGFFCFFRDITGHKLMEEALQESKIHIKRKLDAILEPEGDIGVLELADIIDYKAIQSLMDDFYKLTHIGVGIIDLHGNVLVATGWQDICMKFHRINPETCGHCLESDIRLSCDVPPGTFKLYKCNNNMWDMATPIVVGGLHIGNLFLGQFFFDEEDLPYDTFRLQAKQYGFDEKAYIEALERVPRWSRELVNSAMEFYTKLTHLISALCYGNIKLSRTLAERDTLFNSLCESEVRFRSYIEQAPDGVFITDDKGNYVEVNEAASILTGYSKEELLKMNILEIVSPEDHKKALLHFKTVLETGTAVGDIHLLTRDKEKRICTVKAVKLSETRFLGFTSDITESKRVEDEREITINLLSLLTASNDLPELIASVTELLQSWSGCEAVGIRLKDGDDYPYYQTQGFAASFVKLENSLCTCDIQGQILRDNCGNPILECMCGNIICGRFDPKMPFFTEHGSFWTNSTSEMLTGTTEADRLTRTRNRCNGEGYESVALVPLRSHGETLGLIQLNDSRKGIFTTESIALFERLGDSIALALAQRQAQKTVKQNEKKLASIFRATPIGIGVVVNRVFTDVNVCMSEMTGYSYNELIGSNTRMLYPSQEDFEYVGREKYRQIAEKGTGTVESRWRREDGSIIDVLLSSTPIDTSDLSKGVTSTALDITERKKAEMALADEAVRRRILIEQSRDGIVILDVNGKVYEANQRYAEMLGYSPQEISQLHVWDWDIKWNREQLLEIIAALDEAGDHFETQHRRKDGTFIDVEISSNAAFFDGQKLVFCVCRDISERKRAEKELLESESRNRLILDNSPMAVFLGRDGKYIYANSMGVTCLGYASPEEVIGLPVEKTVSTSCMDVIRERMKNLPKEQANPPMELTIIRPDNKECVLEAVSVPIMLEDGPASLVMGVDITERRKTEEALKKSEERLLLAMDASDYGFWDLNVDTKQMYCSPQVYNMLGFREEELQSNIFLNPDIFYPDDRMTTLAEMGKALKKVAPLNLDCRLKHKSGECIWVSIKGKPFDIDETGIPHRFVGTIVNITPRVKAEEALSYAKAAATESNRIKSDLLANVTHELKTPLTAVIGFSDVMLEQENKNLDDLQKRYLHHINKGGRDLLTTINKILDFSKYESAELGSLSLGKISVKQLIQDTIGVLCLQSIKKNQTIDIKIDPDIHEFLADEYKLKQILYNLVENAIKFTGEKGSINIEVSLTEDMLQFSVRDSGIGIAKESIDKIFDPFIQIDGSISRKYGGTGMGLALVKRFVELHGGSIRVESKPGQGSNFIFEIPATIEVKSTKDQMILL